MNHEMCLFRDRFLIGDLDADERERFEAHLAECFSCRSEVAQEEQITALVRQSSTVDLPDELSQRVRSRWEAAESRRRHFAVALAATAAVALLFLGWFALAPGPIGVREAPLAREKPSLPTPKPQPAPPSTVHVSVPDDVLAVEIPSGDPDVTLIHLYPTTSVGTKFQPPTRDATQ